MPSGVAYISQLLALSAHIREPFVETVKKSRRSGIPTGNAGEYFVMGELLRRGYDAQLADRNTKGYDILVARKDKAPFHRIQVKAVRSQPWYVKQASFKDDAFLDQVTVYVLLGKEDAKAKIRYFVVPNRLVAEHVHVPNTSWHNSAFMPLKAIEQYDGRWDLLWTEHDDGC